MVKRGKEQGNYGAEGQGRDPILEVGGFKKQDVRASAIFLFLSVWINLGALDQMTGIILSPAPPLTCSLPLW